jgi:formylglycine-generating enzyme required for sulfatase activity
LDKYLVTVGRFRQFVIAWNGGSGYTPPAGSGKHTHLNGGQGLLNSAIGAGTTYEPGWVTSNDVNVAPTNSNLACTRNSNSPTWTPTPGSQESLPIDCVNWWEAVAFCIWDGGFLPSEAEWEYTAAGGAEQRAYPWGSTDPGSDNQYAIYGCHYPSGVDACAYSLENVAPVGTPALGAGRYGQLDLVGDLHVWTADWYGNPYYAVPCTDCANLAEASDAGRDERMVRSAHRFQSAGNLVPSRALTYTPDARGDIIGFRCARAP